MSAFTDLVAFMEEHSVPDPLDINCYVVEEGAAPVLRAFFEPVHDAGTDLPGWPQND